MVAIAVGLGALLLRAAAAWHPTPHSKAPNATAGAKTAKYKNKQAPALFAGFRNPSNQSWAYSGERLRNWPARWFEYARDLSITKTYRGHHGNCIAGTWVSRYTHPETGKQILERGAELFYLRGVKVYEHHMWQHSWPEDEAPEDAGFSTD